MGAAAGAHDAASRLATTKIASITGTIIIRFRPLFLVRLPFLLLPTSRRASEAYFNMMNLPPRTSTRADQPEGMPSWSVGLRLRLDTTAV